MHTFVLFIHDHGLNYINLVFKCFFRATLFHAVEQSADNSQMDSCPANRAWAQGKRIKSEAVVKLNLFIVALWLASPCFSQTPVPSGVRQADKVEAQSQQNIPPPASVPRTPVDPGKLKQDAQELATLAASIPAEVNQTTMGMMPKDLEQKLKRIEKLAKHLRSQISP
jgi:hypothetical protein